MSQYSDVAREQDPANRNVRQKNPHDSSRIEFDIVCGILVHTHTDIVRNLGQNIDISMYIQYIQHILLTECTLPEEYVLIC